MVDVQRHREFVAWMDAIVDPASGESLGEDSRAIRQAVNRLIDALEASDGPLSMPRGKRLAGTRFDLHELRWPPLPQGSGPSAMLGSTVIRVLYGYARPAHDLSLRDVAVILLGGDKSPMAESWYATAVPEAERRLMEWCDEHLAFVPRESDE